MTEEVAADAVIDPGGEHSVLEGMAQGVHRVARGLEQSVGAEELVDDCAERGTVAVAGEAFGVLFESLERDTDGDAQRMLDTSDFSKEIM